MLFIVEHDQIDWALKIAAGERGGRGKTLPSDPIKGRPSPSLTSPAVTPYLNIALCNLTS